jgi:hypothetical protein
MTTPEEYYSSGWRVVISILVFIAALAIAALLSIDDVEGRKPGVTEVDR